MQLRDIPLFKSFTTPELQSIKPCLIEREFHKGQLLFREGQTCERIFIVKEGRVKLYRLSNQGKEQVLQTLSPGETCACHAGSSEWLCNTTAEAQIDSVAWFFSIRDYQKLVKSNPQISRNLNKIFAERLQCFSSLIADLSLKDVKKRLIRFLLDMASAQALSDQAEPRNVVLTQEEIAQRLGTTRETVARYLSQLKKNKLIDIKSRQINIRDQDGLKTLLDL